MLLFTAVFAGLKYLSDLIFINNIIIFKAYEILILFIFGFLFCFLTDFSNIKFRDKVEVCTKIALIFTVSVFIISIFKSIFDTNYILIAILNFIIFALLGGLSYIRDRFFLDISNDRNDLLNFIYIGYFVFMKLVFNLLNVLFFSKTDVQNINIIFVCIFGFLLFVIRPLVNTIFLKGYIEHDGTEFPVFEKFKVGKTKNADVIIEDDVSHKNTFFIVSTGKEWHVNPGPDVKVDNKQIVKKVVIDSGETVSYKNNYFTVSKDRGSFFKRFFIFFFIMVFAVFGCFGKEKKKETPLEKYQEVILGNVDSTNFPYIDVYVNIPEKKATGLTKEDFFIIENEKNCVLKGIKTSDLPLEIVFVLDITGSMNDTYLKFQSNLRNFLRDLKETRKSVKVGLITFADKENEMKVYPFTDNPDKFQYNLQSIVAESGGDYPENPYDALFKVKNFTFSPNSQKVVILITDGPPHVKGDKADKGKDFTSYTSDSVYNYVISSQFMFCFVSCERFEEYQKLININRYNFYEMETYDDFSEIINSIKNSLKYQIKLTFQSGHLKDYYGINPKRNILIFKGENAVKAKNVFDAANIKKTSFFESLFGRF